MGVEKRWSLTETEKAEVEERNAEPFRLAEVARALARHPRLVLRAARIGGHEALAGLKDDPELVWFLRTARMRAVAPDAGRGAEHGGVDVFMATLDGLIGPSTKAVEIGVGGGRVARLVAPRVHELVCLDVSRHALLEARETLLAMPNVRLVQNEGFTLGALPDETFDVVYSHDVLLTLELLPVLSLLDEGHRILRSGGVFVASFFTIDRPEWAAEALHRARACARGGPQGASPERPYAECQLRAMYEAVGLEVVAEQYGSPRVAEQVHFVLVGKKRCTT